LATSESNRAIPPYQSGPYDRVGRGQCADGGGPGPQRSRALPGSSRRLPPDSFTIQAESGSHDLQRLRAQPISNRRQPPAGSLSKSALPPDAKAGDGGGRRTRIPASSDARPPSTSGASSLAGSSSKIAGTAPRGAMTTGAAAESNRPGATLQRGRRATRKPRCHPRIR
jgi:hypothetical protein